MNLKPQSVLLGAAIAGALSRAMWAFKAMPLLIWVTLPGWLFAWGLIIALRGEQWLHRDAIGVILVTIGNAALYSWVCFRIMRRRRTAETPRA